ncbi:MAG: tryptophan synthase subunit alpha [Anaerolineae bacterium]
MIKSVPSNGCGAAAIERAFITPRAEGRSALITYLTAGYPSPSQTLRLLQALQAGGADLIELGVPFSDPVADGPAIQRAGQVALREGITPAGCLDLVHQAREAGVNVPMLLMGYYNPILNDGLEAYARDATRAGAQGLIVPDLPLEESEPLGAACRAAGLALVQLVAPNSSEARVARLAAASEGFVYVVSRLGITGAGGVGPLEGLRDQLEVVRRHAHTPVALGFGIAGPEQVRALRGLADGLIVGSAVVERAAEGPRAVEGFVRALRAEM